MVRIDLSTAPKNNALAPQRLLLDAMQVFVTRMVMRGANFVVFLLLARSLSLESLGLYGYLISVLLLMSVACDLGLRQASAKHAGAKADDLDRIFWQLVIAWVPLASLGTLVTIAAMVMFSAESGIPVSITLLIIAAPPVLAVRIGQGLLLGDGRIAAVNRTDLLPRAVLLIGILGLWLLDLLTLERALMVLALSYCGSALALIIELRGLASTRPVWDGALLRGMIVRGFGFAVGIAAMMVFGRVGLALIAHLGGDGAMVGLYFGLHRMSEMVVEIAMAVGVALFSHGVRAPESQRSGQELFGVSLAITSLIAIIVLVLCLLAEPLMFLVLPQADPGAALGFRLLLLAAVPGALSVMLHPGLAARGMPLYGAAAFASGTVCLVLLGFLLIPSYGITGMAGGFLASSLVVALLLCLIYRRRFGVTPGDTLGPVKAVAGAVIRKFSMFRAD